MGEVNGVGLSEVQRRFLGKCRREGRPIGVMLKECRVGVSTFIAWRGVEEFEREFRRATAGVRRDAMAELQMSFALCGKMISEAVAGIGKDKPKLDDKDLKLCFEVVKMGMGMFVSKKGVKKVKRRGLPKVDPELYGRLMKAQGEK